MRSTATRRGFLGGIAAAAAAASLPWSGAHAAPVPPMPPRRAEPWLDSLTGRHRCFFDFPNHAAGLPLIHMYNYLNTYRASYQTKPGEVNAVGSLYFVGPTSSLPLAFNDAMWAKYRIGALLELTDPGTGKPSERNMFWRPRAGDPVLFGGAMADASIEKLQQHGGVFLMCNNAFMFWVSQLAGAGHGTAEAIEKELRANMLPGVHTVPAMVIAIEMAQSAGVAYNRQ